MKPFKESGVKTTMEYGQRFPEATLNAVPDLRGKPWFCLSKAWEFAKRNSIITLQAMCPLTVNQIYTSSSSGKVVKCLVRGGKYNGWSLRYCHLGRALVSVGQQLNGGDVIGKIGGSYGWSGQGTGCHSAVVFMQGGKYRNPKLLLDWQPAKIGTMTNKLYQFEGDGRVFWHIPDPPTAERMFGRDWWKLIRPFPNEGKKWRDSLVSVISWLKEIRNSE